MEMHETEDGRRAASRRTPRNRAPLPGKYSSTRSTGGQSDFAGFAAQTRAGYAPIGADDDRREDMRGASILLVGALALAVLEFFVPGHLDGFDPCFAGVGGGPRT